MRFITFVFALMLLLACPALFLGEPAFTESDQPTDNSDPIAQTYVKPTCLRWSKEKYCSGKVEVRCAEWKLQCAQHTYFSNPGSGSQRCVNWKRKCVKRDVLCKEGNWTASPKCLEWEDMAKVRTK